MKSQCLIVYRKRLAKGGVANFYRMVEPYFGPNVKPYIVGYKIGSKFGPFWGVLCFLTKLCFTPSCKCVLFNPSLGAKAVWRDGIYSFIAKRIFRKKVFILWHGWDLKYEKHLEEKSLPWFRFFYFNVDGMMTLASPFRDKLLEWGYKNPVRLITTATEDLYCDLPRTYKQEPPFSLLFLSRVEEGKGIFLALEAVRIVQQEMGLSLRFIVAGDGDALAETQKRSAELQLQNVEFLGYVRNEVKIDALKHADIFILPSFTEGMPCALLEAMATGLPFITTNVGGIPDLFEEEKMGFLLKTLEPRDFADKIKAFIDNPSLLEQYGRYNRDYARKNLCASKVAAKLERFITE